MLGVLIFSVRVAILMSSDYLILVINISKGWPMSNIAQSFFRANLNHNDSVGCESLKFRCTRNVYHRIIFLTEASKCSHI